MPTATIHGAVCAVRLNTFCGPSVNVPANARSLHGDNEYCVCPLILGPCPTGHVNSTAGFGSGA